MKFGVNIPHGPGIRQNKIKIIVSSCVKYASISSTLQTLFNITSEVPVLQAERTKISYYNSRFVCFFFSSLSPPRRLERKGKEKEGVCLNIVILTSHESVFTAKYLSYGQRHKNKKSTLIQDLFVRSLLLTVGPTGWEKNK